MGRTGSKGHIALPYWHVTRARGRRLTVNSVETAFLTGRGDPWFRVPDKYQAPETRRLSGKTPHSLWGISPQHRGRFLTDRAPAYWYDYKVTLSVIGPLNNIWGPGLSFDVADSGTGTPSFNERYDVYFFVGATLQLDRIVGNATTFVNSNHQSTALIQPVQPVLTRFREGESAGGQVGISIHRVGNNGLDLEPPHVIPAVTWDPALQLQVLFTTITGGSGGFTDADRALLQNIYAGITADVHNAP